MKRRTFLTSGIVASTGAANQAAAQLNPDSDNQDSPLPSNHRTKPAGRLDKSYRVMWDQNGGQSGFYDPPISIETLAQGHLGFFQGTPVDAYVCALGNNTGYTTDYPTQVLGMEFIVDRLNNPETVMGGVNLWKHAENLKHLWQQGIDPLKVQVDEAQRIGIDFWFRLSMNDWHHTDAEGKVYRLIGSKFYSDHPEYQIGPDGVGPKGESDSAYFQDFAHDEVRRLRLDTAVEACERYDVQGFVYDFMRCPKFFRHGEVLKHTPLMTQFMRQTRAALDEVGKKKGKAIGLCVRVPNNISGATNLGLDVATWIKEDLVDIVVPSTFFNADMEEDMRPWVELARNTPVRINPAIEEGYKAGHTGGVTRCFYNPPVTLPLSVDMIRAIAARHHYHGVDGMYTFNWFGTGPTYNYDNREALDDIADPIRLQYRNKRYAVTRHDGTFRECLIEQRQIPSSITGQPKSIHLEVADNLKEAGTRTRSVRLHIHLENLTVIDQLDVTLNGHRLVCENPLEPGGYNPLSRTWQNFAIPADSVNCGDNEITLRLSQQNERLAKELPVQITDLELAIEYDYPNGPWNPSRGFVPRT